nr:hypothetical protein [Escherichia coli]EFG3541109.1 hypothetical protein [Escherichia coli]EFG3757761.1 hypothetical protein [Escherichia coli]
MMSSVSTSGSGAPKSSFSFGRIWDQYGMLVVFAVLFIACAIYSAAIFLIPICISFDTAEKRRYATYLILNRRFSFEF